MVKRKIETKGKGLKVKVAFVCEKESLLRLEEVRMAFLQKEDKRVGNSTLLRMAIDALYEKVLGKK